MSGTQFYVSGPAYAWIGLDPTKGFLSSQTYSYVGYTQSGLEVQIAPSFEDVEADYAGRSPADVQILGLEVRISGIMARYDESVIQRMLTFPSALYSGSTPGGIGPAGIGSLMYAEGNTYPLLVQSPYGFKSQFGTMVPGFAFYSCYLADPTSTNLSIRTKKPQLAWRAIPVFGAIVSGAFVANAAPFDTAAVYTNTLPSPMPTPT